MLGDPGAYVVDRGLARRELEAARQRGDHEERLCTADEELPGTLPARVGAQRLVEGASLAVAGARAGLHVFVTHDILLAIAAARFLGPPAGPQRWPAYLEGAFFWRETRTACTPPTATATAAASAPRTDASSAASSASDSGRLNR